MLQHPTVRKKGKLLLGVLELGGLAIIAVATLIAGGIEVMRMIEERNVTLSDLLLLFIYLEVLAMVGLYLQAGKLPVRMPLYIGIVALARYLILDIKAMDEWRILAVVAAILILVIAVLVLRYGHHHYPYPKPDDD